MPQMSNRKFRIIMQTVCIFRGYCSRLSGEKTNAYRQQGTWNKEPNTRTKIQKPRQSSWSPRSMPSTFHRSHSPLPLLIIIEFLENFAALERGKRKRKRCLSARDFCIWQRKRNERVGFSHHSPIAKNENEYPNAPFPPGLHCIIQLRSLLLHQPVRPPARSFIRPFWLTIMLIMIMIIMHEQNIPGDAVLCLSNHGLHGAPFPRCFWHLMNFFMAASFA